MIRNCGIGVVLALGVSANLPVKAAEWVALSGMELAGPASYFFIGGITPFSGSNLGQGLQGRVWLDRLQYEYKADDITVDAVAPGAHLALGYKMPTLNGAWSLYGGVGQRTTRLSPDQRDADNRGTHTGVILLAEAYQQWPEGWRFDENYSYEIGPDNYWLRVKGGKRLGTHDQHHGLALVISGGPDYHVNKVGYALDGVAVGGGVSMNFGTGVSRARELPSEAYVALEIVYVRTH